MSYFEEREIDFNYIDAGRHHLISSFHNEIIGSKFQLTNSFSNFMPNIMLCKYERNPIVSPDIAFVGGDSSQIQLFGRKWAHDAINTKRTPDPKLEKRSAQAYAQAAEYGYSMHLSEGIVQTLSGDRLATFIRHITPLDLGNGAKLFCVAGILLDLQLQ